MTTLLQLGVTGAFFCIKQKNCAILAIEQLPYNAKSQNSEESGYFEEVFLLKQRQKHASSFFYPQALDLAFIFQIGTLNPDGINECFSFN